MSFEKNKEIENFLPLKLRKIAAKRTIFDFFSEKEIYAGVRVRGSAAHR